eukprot:gene6804-4884_t
MWEKNKLKDTNQSEFEHYSSDTTREVKQNRTEQTNKQTNNNNNNNNKKNKRTRT